MESGNHVRALVLYLQHKIEKCLRNKLSFWRSNANSSYIQMYFLCFDVPKGQISQAALESTKQNKSSDFEHRHLGPGFKKKLSRVHV